MDVDLPSSQLVDVAFRLRGTTVPLDHSYALLGALSRICPIIHGENAWGVHPIRGQKTGPGLLSLTPRSRVQIRLPADQLVHLFPLVGASLELDGHSLQLVTWEVFPLQPAALLKAHLVTIKGFQDLEPFEQALRRQLAALEGLGQPAESIEVVIGPRRVLRAGGRTVVGFAVGLTGLSPDASLTIQARGLGGRRHLGCGLFLPEVHLA